MSNKVFIRADDLVRDAFALAAQVYDSGYRPEVLLVLWRGGTPVGVVVHEYLQFRGIETYHAAVKATSYTGIGERVDPVVEHLDSVLADLRPDQPVLVIDDIFDSGCTVRRIRHLLGEKTTNVRIATLYYKPDSNQTDIIPDYYQRKTDRWIVFPHELMGLSMDEIREKDPFIADLLCN